MIRHPHRTHVVTCVLAGITVAMLHAQSAYAHNDPPPHFDTCWGGMLCLPFSVIGTSLTNAFFYFASFIVLSLFVIGAALTVISAGNDTLLQKGKNMMISSLIGLAIIVGSFAIWRTVVSILYSAQ